MKPHPKMAEYQLRLVAQEVARRNFRLKKVVLHHRVGFVPAGEASLFLHVQGGHRAEPLSRRANGSWMN